MTFLTSTLPGLGKSEYVKYTASLLEHGVCSLAVGGPISKSGLIKQLKNLSRRKYHILHIDVSHIFEANIMDSFVFEVVVIGMAVSGTLMCKSPSSVVILEVSNTHADTLRNSLPICSAFARKHLDWTGFDKFVISDDINSPVQVVCQYLKALNENTLDTRDIEFVGSAQCNPLNTSECQKILQKELTDTEGLSFTKIETFLSLFAQELRKMSTCIYFHTTQVGRIVEAKYKAELRTHFVRKMLEVSKRFSAPSVIFFTRSNETKSREESTSKASVLSADRMVARMKDMMLWNDSNHLFIVFHRQDSQSVTPIYRDIVKVPPDIKHLFQTQMGKDQTFLNYSQLTHVQLRKELDNICRKSSTPFDVEKMEIWEASYALTPDNFLKMILIYLRIQSHIPVIIMGETGCGKTTLVQYLAQICEAPFQKMNLHAGVTEEVIVQFINDVKRIAKCNVPCGSHQGKSTHAKEDTTYVETHNSPTADIWVFFDEINTCDHLGLLNEIVCHHRCKEEFLPANLAFIAACNPYRLKKEILPPAGLEANVKQTRDERSKLVYRVHPLPESMMDYVWDYGALDEEDEDFYIKRMLGENESIFADLVSMSQKFMRQFEGNNHCVSLRDVNRCKHLKRYFIERFFVHTKQPVTLPSSREDHFVNRVDIRSMVLALCHCYHSRLTKAVNRRMYRIRIAKLLTSRNAIAITDNHIQQMIELEQNDLLSRIKLESGTAKNEALRENVFVMLISILNKIPVFVIGKPGCSKSLSMQLIRSTLRGPDSQNEYFKTLPSIYVISYQGSESSTSEGILKVFEKAKTYQEHNPHALPVVLLDEIGLAENSSFNPLRVLHSQLEPKLGDFPSIAVVGISNWALDSAKMNRAIHLSRPEPTKEDLETTAISIRKDSSSSQERTAKPVITDKHIKELATAYFDYQSQLEHRDFHGLRDYYSLIKYIAIESIKPGEKKPRDIVRKGLLRNFGGKDTTPILNAFSVPLGKIQPTKVMDFIKENLSDKNARHLLLISKGDSALNILERFFEGRDHKIIYGSRFKSDRRAEYNYQIISEIILCMERGLTLVMKDLESIYGSLYDMLNQSYTIVGKKKNCRVALGAYSNPMCQVHENFRCVVIVDEKKVNHSDPPFLNRFEKQLLNFTSIMSDSQHKVVDNLDRWTKQWLAAEEELYCREDIFLGFHEGTLPSLVYFRSVDDATKDPKIILEECKQNLLQIASPDAVFNLIKSQLYSVNSQEVEDKQNKYFQLPVHRGFKYFLESYIAELKHPRVVIYTHSSIHFDFNESDEDQSIQTEKLSNFKSEQDLMNSIHQFWNSNATVMTLQCMPALEMDAANMKLAKCRIDQFFKEHSASSNKLVFIVVHLDRNQAESYAYKWYFNFLCEWNQYTIDSLDNSTPVLESFLWKGVSEVLKSTLINWQTLVDANMFLWCFNCIRYTENARSVDSAFQLVDVILHSDDVMDTFKAQVVKYFTIREKHSMPARNSWQTEVACSTELLKTYSTLVEGMIGYIKRSIRIPLAKIVLFLEKSNSWNGITLSRPKSDAKNKVEENTDKYGYWKACLQEDTLFNISDDSVSDPQGSESCWIAQSKIISRYPFFSIFNDMIKNHLRWLLKGADALPGPKYSTKGQEMLCLQLCDLMRKLPTLNYDRFLERHKEEYARELLSSFSERFVPHLLDDFRVELMEMLIRQFKSTYEETEDPYRYIADYYISIYLNQKIISVELQLIAIYGKTKEGIQSLLKQLQQLALASGSENKPTEAECYQDKMDIETHVEVYEDQDQVNAETPIDMHLQDANKSTTVNATRRGHLSKEVVNAILVTTICKALLPYKEVIDKCDGIENWSRMTNVVLLLVGNLSHQTNILKGDMSSETSIFHFLRLCRDFANFVISLKLSDPVILVSSLALLAIKSKYKNVLDNETIYLYLTKKLAELNIPEARLQTFICMYFNLCIEANLDTPILEYMLKSISAETKPLMVGFRQVLRKVLHNDIKEDKPQSGCLPICERLIFRIDTKFKEIFPNIAAVDEALQQFNTESHFSVTCCDIIEDVAFRTLSLNQMKLIGDESTPTYQLLTTAFKSTEVVFKILHKEEQTGPCRKSSIQYVCACAFLRAFVKVVAQFFHTINDPRHFEVGGRYYLFGNALCDIVAQSSNTADHTGLPSLTLYLLKCFRDHKSLFDLVRWIQDLPDNMTFLKELQFHAPLLTSRIGYNPISYVPHYKKIMIAISSWLYDHDKCQINDVIMEAKSSAEHRVGLVAAISETFFFARSTTGNSNTDRLEIEWLLTKVQETFSDYFAVLLQRLLVTGRTCSFLDVSLVTDIRQLYQTSLVLHVACTDIVINKMTVAFLLQEDADADKQNIYTRDKDANAEMIRMDCICGFCMVYAVSQDKPIECIQCHRRIRKSQEKRFLDEKEGNQDGSSERTIMLRTIMDTIRSALLISRLLSSEVHKYEIEIEEAQTDGLSIYLPSTSEEGRKIPATSAASNGSSDKSAKEQNCAKLFDQLNDNWMTLEDCLGKGSEETSFFIHTLMQSVFVARKDFPKDMRFETCVCNAIQNLLPNSSKHQKRYHQACLEAQGIQESFTEHQLEELQCQEESATRKCRVFKKRRTPAYKDFQMQFMAQKSEYNTNFPFLRLFFRCHGQLRYVSHLHIFLKWNLVMKQKLGQSIKRKQAQKDKISSVLEESASPGEKSLTESATNLFSDFQAAWNEVYDAWETLTGSLPKFEIMSKERTLITCVMDTMNQECPLLKIVQVLQQVQNDFLLNALSIASSGSSSALHFLARGPGTGVIQHVSLDNAKDEIVSFKWNDNILQNNSDIGTEFAEGYTITYNFTVIEKALAQSLLMNKAILTDGTAFSQFAFSDDLFHFSSLIVADIMNQIPQKPLSEDALASIESSIKSRKRFASELLENLEIMLVLLKKTGGDTTDTLNDYIKRWSTQLPGSFPSKLLPDTWDVINLNNVVALYTIVEKHVADDYIKSLEQPLRAKIPDNVCKDVNLRLSGIGSIERIESSTSVIRLFAFRYLRPSNKVQRDQLNARLLEVMERYVGDTMDLSALSEIATSGVCVRHVHKIHELAENEIQARKKKQQQEHFDCYETSEIESTAKTHSLGKSVKGKRRSRQGGFDSESTI